MSRADKVFKGNKSLNKLFQTSDGQCFPVKSDARNHSRSLSDQIIKEIHRSGKTEKVKEKKAPDSGQVENSNPGGQMTDDQIILRLVQDNTVEENLKIAADHKVPEAELKGANEEEIARAILKYATESEKELIIQKIEEGSEEEEEEKTGE